MGLLDIFKTDELKEKLEAETAARAKAEQELAAARKLLEETGALSLEALRTQIADLEQTRLSTLEQINVVRKRAELQTAELQAQLDANDATYRTHIEDLNKQIIEKQQKLIIMDEEILLQSFGYYRFHYNFQNAGIYKDRLNENSDAQSELIKEKRAATYPSNWTVNGDLKEGERMVKDIAKLLIRSFNNECDACVATVKYNNIDSMEKRIRKAFESLNKLGERTHVELTSKFLNLKIEELYFTHEFQVMKQKEKEEQKRIREQMREEARIQREIEEMKSKLEKEERHFEKAISAIKAQVESAKSEAEKQILETELHAIEEKKAEVEEQKKDVLYREQNTRAGYVYVISNVGAFGENVYKIGVTRRLDPEERVDELGDASVPFYFDVHALIFSDNAPALETALHHAFDSRRVNAVNKRKEFFRVSLDDIEQVVQTNFSKPVEFVKTAAAEEYRQSLMLLKESVAE